MRLYFLRHAEAVDIAPDDHNRQLTERGRERTRTAAKVMRLLDIGPEVIFSSPRLRALQTAEIVGEALGIEITVHETLNFGFNADDLAGLIDRYDEDAEILFVGHEPDFSDILTDLTGADLIMKKGGLARVDLSHKARPLTGELIWLIAPRVFDALGKE